MASSAPGPAGPAAPSPEDDDAAAAAAAAAADAAAAATTAHDEGEDEKKRGKKEKEKEEEEEKEEIRLAPLPAFTPDLYERAWQSVPHPTLPLLATAHQRCVTVFSLATLSCHSTLAGGHSRSVRSVAWKPPGGAGSSPHSLCLVTGSFDATAGLWRWEGGGGGGGGNDKLEAEITGAGDDDGDGDGDDREWEFTLVLEGHDSEIKSVAFSPAGQYLATCGRDKSVWIWEDVGASEADDEWETVAVLNEHEGDVKAVAWCPDLAAAADDGGGGGGRRRNNNYYSGDVLASASYDDTVRVWREDDESEWVCVAALEGHAGTVWGLQWEPRRPRGGRRDDDDDGRPRSPPLPRLMTWSADRTIRVWTLKEEEGDEGDGQETTQRHAWGGDGGGLGGIPNTMRRSPRREEWTCTATLPQVHTRDIYSVSWSAETGLVASTGSDGVIAIYGEEGGEGGDDDDAAEAAAAELDGDVPMTNGHPETVSGGGGRTESSSTSSSRRRWKVLSTTPNAHGPYEINHVTWCKRYDAACPPERRGVEEMLVTTGDDGVVRPWQILRP